MVNEFAPAKTRGRLCAIISLLANSAAPVTMLLCAWIIPRFTWRPMFVAIGVLMPMIVGWMLTTMGSTSIFIAISVIAAIAAVVAAVFGTETGGKSVG